ncbi:MAG: tetratricopeptide repeat protein [Pseudomonadota bacterium]
MVRRQGKAVAGRKLLQQSDVQGVISLFQAGKHKAAEAKSRKLIRRFGDVPVLYDILSNAQIAQSDFKGAVKTLEALTALEPHHGDGHYNLGLVYMNLGRAEEAIVCFERVIKQKGENPDVYNNLGAAFFELEKFENAISAYEKAVALKPDFVPALRNLGAALRDIRRLEESEKYLSKIPYLMPRYAPGHVSLGVTYKHMGEEAKAQKCFETALKLEPDNREANYELGNILANSKQYERAADAYRTVDTGEARVKVLEMLHQSGDHKEQLLNELDSLNGAEPINLRAAAFSAFVSNQYETNDSHPFAPDPLDFVSICNIDEYLSVEPTFLDELMVEAAKEAAVWEKRTTRGGFQTHGNLFELGGIFNRLEDVLREQIGQYRSERSDSNAGIIKGFPDQFELNGWHVKLVKAGYQKPHIHTRGWISGVLYLKIPKAIKGNEGSIAFSLHGYDYRKEHDNMPLIEHSPKAGELVLFPSSLFHHTIPFESDEDRQCIAFDMLPVRR